MATIAKMLRTYPFVLDLEELVDVVVRVVVVGEDVLGVYVDVDTSKTSQSPFNMERFSLYLLFL